MKKLLNHHDTEVVNVYDEVNLWTAPFGRLLLENIPMKNGMTVLDIGFGTGFPLIELSQRFGENSKIFGIDIWKGGIRRTQEKIKTLELSNIEILEESAVNISLESNSVDLITSNLGINNFDSREEVYKESYRVLKSGGKLVITTNPMGTFRALFQLFEEVMKDLELFDSLEHLSTYVEKRKNIADIIKAFTECKFKLLKSVSDSTNMRFINGESLLNHSLIRAGFRSGWDKLLKENERSTFYKRLTSKIDDIATEKDTFRMTIPLLYLEFEK